MMSTSGNKKIDVKSHLLKGLLAAVFVLGLTIFINSTDVQAATKVRNLKQVNDTSTAVAVGYESNISDVAMYYRISTSKTGVTNETEIPYSYDEAYADTNAAPYMVITGLKAGTTYYVQVGNASEDDYANGVITWSDVLEVVTAPNAAPTNLKHTKSAKNSVTVSWNAANGANQYAIYTLKYGAQTWVYGSETDKTSQTISKLSQNSGYGVRVISAKKNSTGTYVAYGDPSVASVTTADYLPTITAKPTAPVLMSTYKQNGSVKVGVEPLSFAAGYEFEIYDMSTKKVVTTGTSKNGKYIMTVKKSGTALKKNDVYRLRVRSYVTDSNGGKYRSAWSKVSYFASQRSNDSQAVRVNNGIKLSWNKVKGAAKYEIYVSTNGKNGFKKVATTSKRSYVLKKFKNAKLKKGKKYYVIIAPVAKGGGKTYNNILTSWGYKY